MSRFKTSNNKDWPRHKQPFCSRVRWCLGLAVGSLALTTLSFSLLSIPTSSALDASSVDNITIIVPASCSLSGTNTEHTATVNNGTYNSNIGLTTMKAFCNDNEGFSIYAIGYTNEQDGNTVLTNGTAADNIVTGTATSGNTSNWAMKLATPTDPAPTYPLTLGSDTNGSFGDYHIVPSTFTKVAYRTASTDVGQNAEGSTLTSTYQAYISPTQPAGTYTGKVKYILVHPNYVDSEAMNSAITVVFDGNGLTFPDGSTTNTVRYANVCKPGDTVYVGNTYQEVMTSNILPGGVQDGAYTTNQTTLQPVTIPDAGEEVPKIYLQPVTITGADQLKVVIQYGLSSAQVIVIEGEWDGNSEPEHHEDIGGPVTGEDTYTFEGDTVTLMMIIENDDEPEPGYDYGFYAKIYPVYNTEQPNTTAEQLPSDDCSLIPIAGTYAEPVGGEKWVSTFNGSWGNTISYTINFTNCDRQECQGANPEEGLTEFLYYRFDRFPSVQQVTLYAYNPYTIHYNGNGATAGTMEGFVSEAELDVESGSFTLLAPNFYKTGYGFAGWSENPNAVINSTDKIYGPNEDVAANGLNFDSNRETTLYAVWVPYTSTMQGWTGCSNMNEGQVTALIDNRDNNVYTVAKLADGNCWMMENLRLDETAAPLSSANTDNPAATFISLPASSDEWSSGQIDADSVPRINTNNVNMTSANRAPSSNWYGYGNYHNWYSATAGNGNGVSSGNASGSICPNGWNLPTGGSNGQFSALDLALGGTGSGQDTAEASNRWRKFPQNFIYAGLYNIWYRPFYVEERAPYHRGSEGAYWSRTATGGVSTNYGRHIDNLLISDESLSLTGWPYGAAAGMSVRCLTQ